MIQKVLWQPLKVSLADLIAASIHDEYDFGVFSDRNRTLVYLELIYTRKIDKKYANISSDRIHHEYSSGWDCLSSFVSFLPLRRLRGGHVWPGTESFSSICIVSHRSYWLNGFSKVNSPTNPSTSFYNKESWQVCGWIGFRETIRSICLVRQYRKWSRTPRISGYLPLEARKGRILNVGL